jgi:hypothetical protein
MRWCSKSGCPARLSVPGGQGEGRHYLCTQCGASVQEVPFSIAWMGGLVLLVLLLFLLGKVDWGGWWSRLEGAPQEQELIGAFVKALNEGDYEKAYGLSRNDRWEPYERFVTVVWGEVASIALKSEQKKIRPSKFGAEAVYAVEYETVDRLGKRRNFVYDFHLKRFEDQWKIVRLTEPIEDFYAPDLGLRHEDYADKSAEEILRAFFQALSAPEPNRFKKAHFFTMNFSWGNDYKEFEEQSVWQSVRYVHPYRIRPVLHYQGTWGQEAYVVDYLALGKQGQGTYEARYVWHLGQFEGMWKIAKMTELSREQGGLYGELPRLPSRALAVLEQRVEAVRAGTVEVEIFKSEFFQLKGWLGQEDSWEQWACCILARRIDYSLHVLDSLEESMDKYLEVCKAEGLY